MELCIASTLSNLPHHRLFTSNHTHRLRWQSSLPLKQLSIPRTNQGLLYYTNSSLRSTSEDTSSGPSQYVEESGVVTVEEVLPVENNSYAEIAPKEVAKEESALDGQVQAFEFLDELDIKTRVQSTTKLKKIIQDSKEVEMEPDIRSRMQPLKDLLVNTIDHLHTVFETQLFIIICRGFWDQMGQDILRFLENRKENRSWYKGSRVAVSILDDIFASQMQQLLGNALQEKDLEPPRSIMAVRSMLSKNAVNHNDNNYYY